MSGQAGDSTGTAGAGDAPISMRLNEVPLDASPPPVYGPFAPGQVPYAPGYAPPFAPGGPSLASSPARKKAAAEAIRTHIRPQTKNAGDHADEDTSAAVKAFGAKDGDGWITSRALKKAHTTWERQVRALLTRLEGDENGLMGARLNLHGADLLTGQQIRPPSSIDGY